MLMSNSIELKNLVKKFGDVVAVDDVSLEVPEGALLILLGPSGCGKTTILRMLAGLEKPTSGEISYDGKLVANGEKGNIVPSGERNLGMVFQSYALWPHMTIEENIEWPLKIKGWSASERKARIEEVLKIMSISELSKRYPNEISGGQQQRAAITRTIAAKPKVLLFDEPLSNLDAKLRMEMRYELMRIHRITGATSVYVTHDQVEAMTMATHVAVMHKGKIEQFDSPRELLKNPATPFVATFLGTPPANVLSLDQSDGKYYYKGIPVGNVRDKKYEKPLGMYRPENLKLAYEPGDRRIKVELAEAIPVAGRAMVAVWDEGRRIDVVVPDLPEARPGDSLFLEFPTEPDKIFEGNESRD